MATCESLFPTQAAVITFVTNHRGALSQELNISLAHIIVDKINCTTRSGSSKVFSLTPAQGGRRRRSLMQTPAVTPDPYKDVDLAIAMTFTTQQAAARVEQALQSGLANLTAAMQAVVKQSFPPGTGLSVFTALTFAPVVYPPPPMPPPPPPPSPPPSSLPLPAHSPPPVPPPLVSEPITIWASSAGSPRYAKRSARPAGVPMAADKAVGRPQLKQGVTQCKANNAIAWVPTMARPRRLDVYYNASITLGQVDAVVLSVINVGSKTPALQSVQLVLEDQSTVTVYTGSKAGPNPACAALNLFRLPATAVLASKAGMRVVGVRVVPSQERVPGKVHLIHVRITSLQALRST